MDAKEDVKIKVKIFVDKECNRVVFAEADRDFVDVLFSFLTLPMGTIVRLLRKQSLVSELGSMNTLYEGLEKLDVGYFITSMHKDVLLRPSNSAEAECRKLKVNIDDTKPTKYYCCIRCLDGLYHLGGLPSTSLGTKCTWCNKRTIQTYLIEDNAIQEDDNGGVFVKGIAKFTISDDLKVMPMPASSSFELLFKLGIKGINVLEERNVEVGTTEVLSLLRLSLLSKTPLTDLFLLKHADSCSELVFYPPALTIFQCKIFGFGDVKNMVLKVMLSKSKNKILYAESQADFVNYLLSFFTIPLGKTVELLEKSPSLGCISNMYTSAEEHRYMKSEYLRTKLISPSISAQYCYKNHPLDVKKGFYPQDPCKFELFDSSRSEKCVKTFNLDGSPLNDNPVGINGLVEMLTMYMVTDDLNVMPSSYTASVSLLNKLKVPIDDLEEQEVSIGKEEALRILEASLTCKTALTRALNLHLLKKPKIEK